MSLFGIINSGLCNFVYLIKSNHTFKNKIRIIFTWLRINLKFLLFAKLFKLKQEKIFGYKSGNYGETRIYAFLAERYLSYWFNKYTKPLIWPVAFFDINKNKIDS